MQAAEEEGSGGLEVAGMVEKDQASPSDKHSILVAIFHKQQHPFIELYFF